MNKPAKFLLSTTAAFALLLVGCTPSDPMPEGVDMQLENVSYLEWEELDGRREYRVEADGETLLATNLRHGHVRYNGPLDALRVRATASGDREGESVDEAEILKAEHVERLVLTWDTEIYQQPFLGLRLPRSRSSQGLEDQPHIIPVDVEDIELVLFGEEFERDDSIVNSPFEIRRNSVREYGPYEELPLPRSD